MNSNTRWTQALFALMAGLVCLAFVMSVSAQVQTTTTTTSQPSTVTTTVERGEIVYVNGRDLIIKMEDGTLRHFSNVPDSATATVNGKEINIHDAKVGMKLEKTVITTSTPKTITTTQTVTGKVFYIMPPTTVILTLQDGSNQQFKIPKGQKFNVEGQMVDAWGLKKGMNVSATKIVEEPVTEIERQKQLTGTLPPPPPPPAEDQPIVIAVLTPPPTPGAPEMPKTGSILPLIGLLGLASVAGSLGLRGVRN